MKKAIIMIILFFSLSFMACGDRDISSDSKTNHPNSYEIYQKASNEYKELNTLSLYAKYKVKGRSNDEIYIDNETIIDTTQIKTGEDLIKHTKQSVQVYEKNIYDEYIHHISEQFYRDGYAYIITPNAEKIKMKVPTQAIMEQAFLYQFDFDESMIKDQSILENNKYVFVLDEQKMKQEVLDRLSFFCTEANTYENVVFRSIVFSVALEDGNIADTSLFCVGSIDENARSLEFEFSIDLRVKSTKDLKIDFPEDLDQYHETTLIQAQ